MSKKMSKMELPSVDMGTTFMTQAQREDAKLQRVNLIELDNLRDFEQHPFKPYSEQRLQDLAESIRDNGILEPIIVRPVNENDDMTYFVILAGHNRVRAARIAGRNPIPAIVVKGLTDAEYLLIVTQTNMYQRSIADMSHSELALVITMNHEATKQQGRRNDLINEIETLLNASNINDSATSSPSGTKLANKVFTGVKYDLGKSSRARYLRIHKLIDPLKVMLDEEDKFGIRAAVQLSYMTGEEQYIVANALESFQGWLDENKAEELRGASGKKPFDHKTVENILAGMKKKPNPHQSASLKLTTDIMEYFTPNAKKSEIKTDIVEGLKLLRAHRAQKGG